MTPDTLNDMRHELIGALAGLLTTLAFVPQVVRAWRTRSTNDLSYGMLAMFSAGVALWIVYGLALQAPSIVWANAVTLALSVTLVVLKLRF